MVILTYKPTNKEFSMDGYLNSNLDLILSKAIPNYWDCFGIIFGREGAGKTTIATQICYRLDPNFTVKNIVWTTQQMSKAIDETKDESSILWDEAITGAKSSQHAEEISQLLISKLTMIRKKRLKIIICFPYLYMLNKYFVSRCLFSIYVYAKGFTDRGYAKAYNSRNSEKLYNLMKEKYKYDYAGAFREARHDFHFRFTSMFCCDEAEYDRLKSKYSKLEEKTKEVNKAQLQLNKVLNNMVMYGMTQNEIAKYFEVGRSTVVRWINKLKDKDSIDFNEESVSCTTVHSDYILNKDTLVNKDEHLTNIQDNLT
jgi:DNA-directed RNA polymerase specialized sigma subunit